MIVDIRKDSIVVTGFYQYDYGQSMEFAGCVVPDGTEVHFFQGEHSCRTAVSQQIVKIPDYLFSLDKNILAFMYLADENEGKTIKRFTILNYPRKRPPDYVDPSKPADYSRLLPVGGMAGDSLLRTVDGYEWKNYDNIFATDKELAEIAATVPQFASMKEVEDILNQEG